MSLGSKLPDGGYWRSRGDTRAHGRILEFDRATGRGIIRYREFKVPFSVKDINNLAPENIKIDQEVVFECEHTSHRSMRARDISIYMRRRQAHPYPPLDPDEIEYEDRPSSVVTEHGTSKEENLNQNINSQPDLIALGLISGAVKLLALAEDGSCKYLDERERLHNLLYTVPSETLQIERAIGELESLVNDPRASEGEFQNFFERNPDFILNDEYKEAHPHIILTQDDGSRLIPDFMLEPVDQNSLCDLLELKLPTAAVYVLKKNRPRFSAAVYEAASQLRAYSQFFDEEKNRRAFKGAYPQLQAYKPRMMIIIGRRSDASPLLQRQIQSFDPDLTLKTYDEVLQRMRWKAEQMRRRSVRYC